MVLDNVKVGGINIRHAVIISESESRGSPGARYILGSLPTARNNTWFQTTTTTTSIFSRIVIKSICMERKKLGFSRQVKKSNLIRACNLRF